MSTLLYNNLKQAEIYSKQINELESDIFIKKYLLYLETVKKFKTIKNNIKWLYFKELFLSTTNGLNLLLNEFLSDDDKIILIYAERRFSGKVKINRKKIISDSDFISIYTRKDIIHKCFSYTNIRIEYSDNYFNRDIKYFLSKLNKKFPIEIQIDSKLIINNNLFSEFKNFNNLTLEINCDFILANSSDNANNLINFIVNNNNFIRIEFSASYNKYTIGYRQSFVHSVNECLKLKNISKKIDVSIVH